MLFVRRVGIKIVIAPDSFKGSTTSEEVAKAVERRLKRADPTVETVLVPVADGGKGTMDSLVAATGGRIIETTVIGPLYTPRSATGIPQNR